MVERLRQDASNAEYSAAEGKPLSPARAQAIEAENHKTIKQPSDGQFIGDWRSGEQLTQNGHGMTWTDASAATRTNGGNCYNRHQTNRSEIMASLLDPKSPVNQ